MERRTRDDIVENIGHGRLRKWEELNKDCLANIFGRVGLVGLIWSLPFVCKNWYTASLNPHLFAILDFPKFYKTLFVNHVTPPMVARQRWCHKFPLCQLVKFAVDRSQGTATDIILRVSHFEDVMTYISNGCPLLKMLDLQLGLLGEDNMECISNLIKNFHFQDIISEISTHCKNFASLTTAKDITDEAATAIVTLLPNVRCLNLSRSTLGRKNLVRILSQCKKLEFLDVSICEGFDANDGEIHKMASHIQTFLSDGSVVQIEDDDDEFSCYFDN